MAALAKKYSVSYEAMRRHFRRHLQKSLQRHAEANREEWKYGSRLATQLQFISDKAGEILEQAQRSGQLGIALKSLSELRESAKLLAISMGELEGEGHKTQVNIQVNNERMDKLVDVDTQIRVAVSYLERHAPHLLAHVLDSEQRHELAADSEQQPEHDSVVVLERNL
jgi:hypothetical protein